MDFGEINFEIPLPVRRLGHAVNRVIQLVRQNPEPAKELPPPRRRLGKALIWGFVIVVAASLYFDWFRISRLWTDKVYVACNFRPPGHPAYIRGRPIRISRRPSGGSGEGETFRIAGGGGATIARNHFVVGNPDEDFKVVEARCAQEEFDVQQYKLWKVCPNDLMPNDRRRSFFVLAQGMRKTSPRPIRLQVRCLDNSFDDFADIAAETTPAINSLVPPRPTPERQTRRPRTTQKGAGRGHPRPRRTVVEPVSPPPPPPPRPPGGWSGPR